MNYQSLLIVTYGRSGSTLLQGVINTIDNCLIRGENNNFCFHLFKAYQAILKGKEKASGVKADYPATVVNHPWYGISLLDDKLFIHQCKQLVKDLILADKSSDPEIFCYGFKERYTYPEILAEFTDYLNFLSQIFPRVGFIFNTRNLDDVLQSGWWRDRDYDKSKEILWKTENRFTQYLNQYSNTFAISYEDVINKTSNLKDMFEFIGAIYQPDKIDAVLSQRYSYDLSQERIKLLT